MPPVCTIRRCATHIVVAASSTPQHGRTFFLATRLLAPEQRPAVHALYGFARHADDILDDFDPAIQTPIVPTGLQHLATSCSTGPPRASRMTAIRRWRRWSTRARSYGIPWELFDDFLASMRMDLTITDYPDRAALDRYMYGSAEVIGLQLLPVLGTVVHARKPHRTPRRWEKPFSSPTSCATSMRI